MVQLNPITFDEVGLRPQDGAWVCCKDADAFTLCDLAVVISAEYLGEDYRGFPDYSWQIIEIHATKPVPGHRFRSHWAQLTGASFEDAKAWLLAREMDRLDTHVAHDYQIAESGAKADQVKGEAV